MPVNHSAAEAWAALSAPWQECFELAWQSFCSGGLAIGAVVTDPAGHVLGRGRNRRFGTAGAAPLEGLLGHAEINALAEGLPPDKVRRRDADAPLRSVERDSPELAELAREVAVALQGRDGPGTATEALRRVWDLLTSATDPESATQPP